jgi:hypothetical protein
MNDITQFFIIAVGILLIYYIIFKWFIRHKAKHYAKKQYGMPRTSVNVPMPRYVTPAPIAGRDYKPGEFDYLKKVDESYYLPYEEYCRRRYGQSQLMG